MNKYNKSRLYMFLRQTEEAIQARDLDTARKSYSALLNAQVTTMDMGETLPSEFLEKFDVVLNDLAGLEALIEFTEPLFLSELKYKPGDMVFFPKYQHEENTTLSQSATVIELTSNDLHPYKVQFANGHVCAAREEEIELVIAVEIPVKAEV